MAKTVKATRVVFVNVPLIKAALSNRVTVKPQKAKVVQNPVYSKPKVKRLEPSKPNRKIVMGCWQSSYSANDGDGC